MKIKVRLDYIYLCMISLILWEQTFTAPLLWISSVRPIANSVSSVCRLLFMVFFIFFAVIKITKRPSKFDIVAIAVIICIFISSKIINENKLLYTALIVMATRYVDITKALKIYSKNILAILAAILLVFMVGLTSDKVVDFTYGVGHSLGTGHPNVLASLILNCALVYFYLYAKNKSLVVLGLSLTIGIIVWLITASRTSSLLLISFGIVYALFEPLKKMKLKWLTNVTKLLIIAVILGSVYLMLNGGQLFGITDQNFYMRFIQANRIYNAYGIHMWGNNIDFVTAAEAASTGIKAVILDNGYLRLLLYYGSVCAGIFLAGIIWLIRKAGKAKNQQLLIMIFIFILGGLMETSVYTLQFNFTLLFIATSLDGFQNNRESINRRLGVNLNGKEQC